jgi:hypothetical protein
MFMPFVLIAFFIIVVLGSYFSQIRFTGRGRLDFSFTAGGFVTAIFATIMSMKDGLLAPMYLIGSWIIAIIGVAYMFMSSQDQ